MDSRHAPVTIHRPSEGMTAISFCVNISNETLKLWGIIIGFDLTVFTFRIWRYGHP